MSRILLILSVALMLGSAVLGYFNKTHLDDAKTAIDSANAKVSAAQSEATKTKKDLATANATLATQAAKITEQEQTLASNTTAVAAATSDATNAKAEVTQKDAALAVVQKDFDDYKAAHPDTATAGTTTPDSGAALTELQAKLTSAEAENKVLGDKLAAAESHASDLNKEIENRKNAILAKGLEGQILAVNQPWGFVVLSLGDKNGVVANAEMVVMRDGQRIGKVKISSVEGSNSIADIINSSVAAEQRVLPGDRVIYTGN